MGERWAEPSEAELATIAALRAEATMIQNAVGDSAWNDEVLTPDGAKNVGDLKHRRAEVIDQWRAIERRYPEYYGVSA